MAYLSPVDAFTHLKDRVFEGINQQFPIEGKNRSLHLEGPLTFKEPPDHDDLTAQHAAKVGGGTFATTVMGTVVLKDADGKVLDRKSMRLAELPVMTSRYSYIIDGKERQVDNQWQLKPGVYAKRRANGELETQFNVANKHARAFDVVFDPEKKVFNMQYGASRANIPVYPLLQAMGVTDGELEKTWGKEVLKANQGAPKAKGALASFYRVGHRGAAAESPEAAKQHFLEQMHASTLRPDATEITLGKPYDRVTGEALHAATNKMLKVFNGHPEDDRDSLVFKDLRSAGDFAYDKIRNVRMKQGRTARALETATKVRDVVHFDLFNKPVLEAFTANSAAREATQINPAEMISAAFQTTVMGEGGIKSDRAIENETKFVNPSHFGFIDPAATPEGERTGVTLHLPVGVTKHNNQASIKLYDLRTQQEVKVTAPEFVKSRVVLPDQVKWENGKPVPLSPIVRMSGGGSNEFQDAKFSEAHYVMQHPWQLFGTTTNLVPFMGNTSGNRVSMATRHIEQAISLKDRDVPLVQSATGMTTMPTFERLLGETASQTARATGTVVGVTSKKVTIKDDKGALHATHLYDNYPLNDAKGVMHSTLLDHVKVGAKVKEGDLIADTNFTKGGELALGKNLRVGYIPFLNYNFEDGVVISETAAKKLTSEHLHKATVKVDKKTVLDRNRFQMHHVGVYDNAQLKKLGDDGVIRVGQRVSPGDPLVAAMAPYELKDRTGLSAVRRMMTGAHTDKSIRWDGETAGEVTAVHHAKDGITVHVRTLEPMQIGDKISSRNANKGIVSCHDPLTEVLTDSGWRYFFELTKEDKVCTLRSETRAIEYHTPTALIQVPYEGPMYRFKGRRLDLMTTPNHRHWVRTHRRPEYRFETAETFFGSGRIHLRGGATWQGTEFPSIEIPGRPRRPGSKDHYEFCAPRTYDADDFLEFFGYWVTEGCISGTRIHIGQRKLKNPETYEKIRQVIARLGYTPSCAPDVITFGDPRLASWLRPFGKAIHKYIPKAFLEASPRQLRILADALFAGDGGVYYSEKNNHTRYELFTSSPVLADAYQELALKLGMSASIKPQRRVDKKNVEYVVRWSRKPEVWAMKDARRKTREESWVPYRGLVYCVEVENHLVYIRRNGIPVWSGNCILPDMEMPHTKDGKPIEVALNPSGLGGRMNIGQIYETAAGKIAEKTGKPYIVQSFQAKTDFYQKVKADLAAHGLSDTEELIDPVTKKSLGPALVGPQHMLKLVHQVDKKISVRSGSSIPGGPAESYDLNLQPAKGGGVGGQALGSLGTYALLAHGAKANLREMQSYKSEGPDPQTDSAKKWPSQHNAIWGAIATGSALPPPAPTFAFHKFTELLRGAGINVEKDGHGHSMMLTPLTDKHIIAMAKHELPRPTEVVTTKLNTAGDLIPRPGGLFDEELTGGHGGKKWGRISLAEPLPNPVFETPIKVLTGLNKNQFASVVNGERAVSSSGELTALTNGVTGGAGIKALLGRIDVKKELPRAEAALKIAEGQKIDPALKKVKYLRALDQLGLKPSEAYVLHNLPVIPPVMRPISQLSNKSLRVGDLNQLYKDFAHHNEKLKDPDITRHFTDELKAPLRKSLYAAAKAVVGVGKPYADAEHKGLLHQVTGSSPKEGFFQDVLVNRRQDLSMRSTIVPEPSLGLDEVGVPREAALNLFRPFVTRKLKEMGAIRHELEASALIAKKTPAVWTALDRVMEERPVLMKRDPALHKFNVQGFRARAVAGNAVQIHPLITGGFNADFDGDTMSLYVPITREAVTEARNMFPSKNLFSEATGRLMHQPTLESALGLYKMTAQGKKTEHSFVNHDAVIEAAKKETIGMTDVVRIPGGQTTAGRVLLAGVLPAPMKKSMLHDLPTQLDKKGLDDLLMTVGKNHAEDYGVVANRLKELGNGMAFGVVEVPRADPTKSVNFRSVGKTPVAVDAPKNVIAVGTHSLSMKDLAPDTHVRDHVLAPAAKLSQAVRMNGAISRAQQDQQIVEIYRKAGDEMKVLHEVKQDKDPSNLYTMYKAGVKPGWTQYKQMILAPLIYQDSANRDIPVPVTKSFAEGFDVGGYWTQMHGARRGTVMKVQEVRDPGAISKQMVNGMMHMVIGHADCGTDKGISLGIDDKEIHDRYLQQSFTHGSMHIPAGELLTTDLVGKIRAAKKDARLSVRSPLKCEEEVGVCQHCAGLAANGKHFALGTNIGLQSAQAVGERAVQLTLKSFHTGGVAGAKGAVDNFEAFDRLMRLPKKVPDQASLAMTGGKVESIVPTATGVNIFINGQVHHVGKDREGNGLHTPYFAGGTPGWTPPKVGMHVKPGESLSDPARTVVNPLHLFEATKSMEEVQNYMTNKVYQIYAGEGVKRRAIETVVKAMTNLTQVDYAGDHPTVLRGEFRPLSVINKMNRDLATSGKQLIEHSPVLKGITVVPKEIHEDWMAKLQHEGLRGTLLQAAATRGVSNFHGPHPIPGLAQGSQFGLTEKDSLRPGQEHLRNVPNTHY